MLSHWPIRRKLFLGLGLLVLVVAILSSTGLVATYAYRNLVSSLSWRVSELPLAAELSQHVSDLRITLGELRGLQVNTFPDPHRDLVPLRVRMARDQFRSQFDDVDQTLARYQDHLAGEQRAEPRMSDHEREQETVRKIENQLDRIRAANRDEDWMLDNVKIGWLDVELGRLQALTPGVAQPLAREAGRLFARGARPVRTADPHRAGPPPPRRRWSFWCSCGSPIAGFSCRCGR